MKPNLYLLLSFSLIVACGKTESQDSKPGPKKSEPSAERTPPDDSDKVPTIDSAPLSDAAKDYQLICEMAAKYGDDTSLSDEKRRTLFTLEVPQKLVTPDARTAFEAIANAAPDQMFLLLQAGASEQGVENWACPAFEKVYGKQKGI